MRASLVNLTAALLLAACSSSDPSPAPPPPPPADPPVAGTQVPTSATVNSEAATQFVGVTAAAANDGGEPLEVGSVQLATSDTAEPRD